MVEFDPWWHCAALPIAPFNINTVSTVLLTAIAACFAGFALTRMVQFSVPLEVRKQLLVFGHLAGAFIWTLPLITCSAWVFPILVASLFLWGAEPYDNILSASFWRLVLRSDSFAVGAAAHSTHGVGAARKLAEDSAHEGRDTRVGVPQRAGDGVGKGGGGSARWVHIYWAVSCPLVHFWFVAGSAALIQGLFRPDWFMLAIPSFWLSHCARVLSYSHHDAAASLLEVVGFSGVAGCLAWAAADGQPWWVLMWLAVMTVERSTHLPAACKRDAAWMRSYELWEALLAEAGAVDGTGGIRFLADAAQPKGESRTESGASSGLDLDLEPGRD